MPQSETERVAQRIVTGRKFLVLHWFNNPNSRDRAFTILTATPEGIDYHGAFKVSVTATQDSTETKWVGYLAIMPGAGTIFADMASENLDSFRSEVVLVT
jgi:hypothetical protein